MMTVIKALLLFLLCDIAFSQDSCEDALAELSSADSECQQAYYEVANATDSENTADWENVTRSTLEQYCSPSCRPFVDKIATECVSGI